jgi:hypothetical protein
MVLYWTMSRNPMAQAMRIESNDLLRWPEKRHQWQTSDRSRRRRFRNEERLLRPQAHAVGQNAVRYIAGDGQREAIAAMNFLRGFIHQVSLWSVGTTLAPVLGKSFGQLESNSGSSSDDNSGFVV